MWNVAHGNQVLRNSQIFEKLVRQKYLIEFEGSSPFHKNTNQSKPVNLTCKGKYFNHVHIYILEQCSG